MTSPTDEKMKALLREVGYSLTDAKYAKELKQVFRASCGVGYLLRSGAIDYGGYGSRMGEEDAWAACLAHAESEEGLERNFAKAVTLLPTVTFVLNVAGKEPGIYTCFGGQVKGKAESHAGKGPTPQAAAWALLKKVRGVA